MKVCLHLPLKGSPGSFRASAQCPQGPRLLFFPPLSQHMASILRDTVQDAILWSKSQAWRRRKAEAQKLSPMNLPEVQHSTSVCIYWSEWNHIAMASTGEAGRRRILFWVQWAQLIIRVYHQGRGRAWLVGKQLAVLPWNLSAGHTLGRTVISDS